VLVALTGPLQYLPHCVLASVVFTIAIGMLDVKGLKAILAVSAAEFRLALFAAAAVPCIGVEQGILLAIVLSLIGHVRHSYRPHITLLTPDASGLWEPTVARPGLQTAPGLIVYRFGADLFYANVDRFADKARELIATAPSPVRGFVIDAGALTDIDFSAGRTFRDLLAELKDRQIDVVMGRVSADLRADLERHGIVEALGAEKIFRTLHQALEAVGVEVKSRIGSTPEGST
jgi:MFS superfamily sulfate permease-like transporter